MMARARQLVVYINHTGKVSGAENILLAMLRGLDRSKYEATVLCPPDGQLASMAQAEDVPWVSIPAFRARFTWRPDYILRYFVQLAKVMKQARSEVVRLEPDFVHAGTVRAGIVATLATLFTHVPVIWHVHDTLPAHPLSSLVRWLAFGSRRVQILAVSQATADSFCGDLPFGNRATVLYNGVDLSRFPLKTTGPSTLKQELGIPQDNFLMCAVGQICARKGLKELVDAFSRIALVTPTLHLAIIGKAVFAHDEDYSENLKLSVQQYEIGDQVHFTGALPDVAMALQSSDLLILNSFDEPFGLVLVESMSCGTPVLATRVGGVPEIVTHGETGWLLDGHDSRTLAEAMIELSTREDLLQALANRARNTVCPRFSVQNFLINLHSYYAGLTDRFRHSVPVSTSKQVEGGQCV